MRIEQLNHFVQIAQTGTFTSAAQKLFIAQPSLTESINRLEKEIGYELFIRSRKGVKLTQKGTEILPIAINILSEMDYIKNLNDYNRINETFCGTFYLATISSLKSYINNVLIALNKLYPHMSTNILFSTSKQIIDSVIANECDLGILNLGKNGLNYIDTTNFELQHLFYRHPYFIVSKKSSLSSKKSISLSTIAKYNFSVVSDGRNFSVINYLFNNMEMPHISFTSTEFSLTLNHIKNFESVGLLLLNHENPIIPNGLLSDFAVIPLREPIHIDFYCYYSKELSSEKKQVVKNLLSCLEEYF